MQTNRFETFFDAILAIIMTVLVLKLSQPSSPTLNGLLGMENIFVSYAICFLILFNIWYANHNLFHAVETIDNSAVWLFGIMTFFITLLPYFTIITHILNTLATKEVYKSNPYNKELENLNNDSVYLNLPVIVLITGFILTYTIFVPGIYICCLISIVLWIIIGRYVRGDDDGN